MYLRFGPFEGSRVAIVAFDEFIDGMAQLSDTGKVGSSQGLAAHDVHRMPASFAATETGFNLISAG